MDNQENLIFIGSPGVSKTHLSIGVSIEACQQGVRTLFINCHKLIMRLKKAQEKHHLERVMRRYELRSTIITTNVPLSSWGAILHNQAIAEAMLDRLVYHSHVIKIKKCHIV